MTNGREGEGQDSETDEAKAQPTRTRPNVRAFRLGSQEVEELSERKPKCVQ